MDLDWAEAGDEAKIVLSLKSNRQIKLSLFKSVMQTYLLMCCSAFLKQLPWLPYLGRNKHRNACVNRLWLRVFTYNEVYLPFLFLSLEQEVKEICYQKTYLSWFSAFFLLKHKNFPILAIKLCHFIANTFVHMLQTLTINSKNWKMKKNKVR